MLPIPAPGTLAGAGAVVRPRWCSGADPRPKRHGPIPETLLESADERAEGSGPVPEPTPRAAAVLPLLLRKQPQTA